MKKEYSNTLEKITVCVVAPEMPPIIGGAETFAEVLVLALAQAGVCVYLLTARAPRNSVREAVVSSGGAIEIHGDTFGARDGYVAWEWATFSRAEAIHKIITTYSVDVVHALSHDTILAAAIALAGEYQSTKPLLVATTSEMSTEETGFGRGRSRFVYRLKIDGLLQLSQYYLDVAFKAGCNPRAYRIASAIDVDLFSAGNADRGRQYLSLEKERFLITCPSRFSPRKGQRDLLEALQLLPDELQRKMVCLLAGSTNSASQVYSLEIEEMALNSKVPCKVQAISRENMPDIFAATNLIVMPSYKEGLGFAAIEGMVSGCPVLLNEVCGFNEIPNEEGQVMYTTAGDISMLVEKIRHLMTDQKAREELATKGQAHAARQFAPQTFAQNAISLYKELMNAE